MAEGILIARQEEPPPSSITMGGYGGGGDSSSPPSGQSVGVETPRVLSSETTTTGEAATDGAGPSTAAAQGFVNEGEKKWHEQRRGWLACRAGAVQKDKKRRTSSSFLEPAVLSSTKPFPKPIPLSEVVDALLEEWEESGYS